MIKYIGSKRRLLPSILDVVRARPRARTALDLFSGTARVGHALKGAGLAVTANDHNLYAWHLARCYVEADADLLPAVRRAVDALNDIVAALPAPARDGAGDVPASRRRGPDAAGWFTRTFCVDARYFHPANGVRIEAARAAIDALDVDPLVRSVLLVSLMEAADRVDSTVGVQMAYLKAWAPRALQPLTLRAPDLLPRAAGGRSRALRLDARDAAKSGAYDVAYVDPPYNQHSYLANYHVWETLCAWDAPAVYGVARKRVDVKVRKSDYNSKKKALDALRATIDAIDAGLIVVSFNDEGFVDRDEMVALLATRGVVDVRAVPHPRYVGAKIGIYDPRGVKVGRVSHLSNHELIFAVHARALRRAS